MVTISTKMPEASEARIAELLELPGPELPDRCPVRCFRTFKDAFGDGQALSEAVPSALARRRSGEFDREQTDQIWRLAAAWLMAMEVFQERAKARCFLVGPHALLGGRAPLQCAATSESDLIRVEAVLGRLKYGTAA